MSTTDQSILEKITARIREIVRIAEDAASHAMKAEKPPRARQACQRLDGRLSRSLLEERRAAIRSSPIANTIPTP